MEEARTLTERLDRIDTMRRADAGPAELLGELRSLLHEAEIWTRAEGGHRSGVAVSDLRDALAREPVRGAA
ncbi:MAG: hypothetical protein EXQ77_00620 [Thermoleophilia bacterium]|nr:hypothetical protein [Thermoleophilia bacterium]